MWSNIETGSLPVTQDNVGDVFKGGSYSLMLLPLYEPLMKYYESYASASTLWALVTIEKRFWYSKSDRVIPDGSGMDTLLVL